jgi:protein ImuB
VNGSDRAVGAAADMSGAPLAWHALDGGGAPDSLRSGAPAIVLVETVAGRQIVAACCRRARLAGIRAGMTLAHARALLPPRAFSVHPHDPEGDAAALRRLATWAMRFSPLVALDPPDGLLLDIHGCERLFHGERRLTNQLANELEWLGVEARVAVADTVGCARAIARYGAGSRTIVPPGEERTMLAPLPVEALRLEAPTLDALREVNLDCIGELAEVPRLELAARFGVEIARRLDQAYGETPEVVDPIRPVPPLLVERLFEGVVTDQEVVMCAVRQLLDELGNELERRHRGARRIELVCDHPDAETVSITVPMSRPSRDRDHLWALLRPHVESIDLGVGIERIAIAAPRIGPLPHRQTERWRDGTVEARPESDRERAMLVDTLAGRFGSDRVTQVELLETHVPERAVRHRRSLDAPPRTDCPSITRSTRPSLLLSRPESIEVMAAVPEGPPIWLRWRGHEHRIVSSAGPERIGGEWWRPLGATGRCGPSRPESSRDYFRAQDEDGRWLWIFRELTTGRWFVHGEWG